MNPIQLLQVFLINKDGDRAYMVPHDSSVSDSELIECLRQDDLDALGVLFERYRDRVYRTALVIVRDSAVAEDILQDCFLKVYGNAHRIDTSRPLVPWLYRVTVNLSYTWLSRAKNRRMP
jgi:RNA polymerase sigma-70 factor (ECF subfamily)